MFTQLRNEDLLKTALVTGNVTKVMEYLSTKPHISNEHYFSCGVGFAAKEEWVMMMEQLAMMQHQQHQLQDEGPVPVTHSHAFLDLPRDDERLKLFRNIMSFASTKNQFSHLATKQTIEQLASLAGDHESCPFYFFACGLVSTRPSLKEFADSLFSAFDAVNYTSNNKKLPNMSNKSK